ncbi:MAG TPA: YceI family protein [Bryobacteraceae bacterium]|jgi:polyisoprenoid-binding protein YceI|nr:YceI family protein [Bryobacteraceae bacterium]
MRRSAGLFLLAASAFAQQPIDTTKSTIAIHVGKAGLLSSAGHEHWVTAPIASGTIRESPPSVEFTIDTAAMRVKPDPKIDAKTQEQIQKDMDEMTLETAKYPRIEFHSTRVEKTGEAEWRVAGELSLHGVTKPVTINVKRSGGAYAAHTVLKQTDYGIKPIRVGGGMIRVKNEVEIEFEIYPRPS